MINQIKDIDMKQNMFYKHVSSWINSYYNADALEWLHRFINNSNQPQEVKKRLHMEVDRKIASLTNMPFFCEYDDMQLLMDNSLTDRQHPQIFTTRYAAMGKVIELRMLGYDARLLEGNSFYRIQLVQSQPINFQQAPADLITRAAIRRPLKMTA